jgi:hypothetical protein
MPDLEPITREEMLLDGQDLEPITRKEMFIKRIYDKTQVIPEPITREEMFLKKAGDETTDVTIEQLSVSENGTYSEEGKAYSPVIVNVPAPPIPDNAYLLNEVEGLPSDIATFSDGSNLPMPSLKIGIEPIQSGSGDPSPSNVRPISGWSEANVSVCGVNVWDEEWEVGGISVNTGQNESANDIIRCKNHIHVKPNTTYHIVDSRKVYCLFLYDKNKNYITMVNVADIQGANYTVRNDCHYIRFRCFASYGATYKNDISINYPSTDTEYHAYNGQTYNIQFRDGDNPLTVYGGTLDVVSGSMLVTKANKVFNGEETWGYINGFFFANGLSPNGKNNTPSMTSNGINVAIVNNNQVRVYLEFNPSITADTDMNEIFNSGSQLVYELATPITYQLTPTQVKSLLGSNNVWADTGKIEELEYFSKEV